LEFLKIKAFKDGLGPSAGRPRAPPSLYSCIV